MTYAPPASRRSSSSAPPAISSQGLRAEAAGSAGRGVSSGSGNFVPSRVAAVSAACGRATASTGGGAVSPTGPRTWTVASTVSVESGRTTSSTGRSIIAAASASTICRTLWKRSSGSLAIAFRITRSTASGRSGLIWRGNGRSALTCLSITARGVSAS